MTANGAERADGASGRFGRWWVVAIIVGLPIVVAIVAASRVDWYPSSDWALIELRVRDVGAHTPLVGPFSRFGWNHPGPMLFWLLALPYRLSGGASWALLVGAGCINLGATTLTVWVAHRRGGPALSVLTGLFLLVFMAGLGADQLVDPWNPSIVMLPFLLLGFLTWSISDGDVLLAPLWVVVASFVGQSHIGYLPLVAVLGVWACGWLVVTRPKDSVRVLRWIGGAALLGVVLWLPPLVQQFTGARGNLAEIAHHFAGGQPAVGFDPAASVYSLHFAPYGVWLGADEPIEPFGGSLLSAPITTALPAFTILVGAVVWATKAKKRGPALLAGQTLACVVIGFPIASRVTGEVFPYLFGWVRVLAFFLWLSVVWVAWNQIASVWRDRVLVVAGPLTAAVLLAFVCIDAASITPPLPNISRSIAAVADPTVAAVQGRTVLMWSRGTCLSEATYGIALQLDKKGIPIVAADDLVPRYGEHRRWDGENAQVRATVTCRDQQSKAVADAAANPAFELVARFDPLTEADHAEFDQVKEGIRQDLRFLHRDDLIEQVDTGYIIFTGRQAGVDPARMDRYIELIRKSADGVVVLFEPPAGA